jgi:hypothetical protein
MFILYIRTLPPLTVQQLPAVIMVIDLPPLWQIAILWDASFIPNVPALLAHGF